MKQTFRNKAVYPLALMMVLACQCLVLAQERAKPAPPDPMAISRPDRLKVFEKLWETVNREYFDPSFNGVDWAQVKATYRAPVEAASTKTQLAVILQQMLNELHSSHLTVTLRATLDKSRIQQDLTRKVAGGERFRFDPGLQFTRVDGRRVVDSIVEASGAQLAGVTRGWTLTHWNGEPDRNGLSTACELGDTVSLRFLDDHGRERIVDIMCKLYPVPPGPPLRTTRMLDGGAVYVRFTAFSRGTNTWLAEQVQSHHEAPAIIIDLRGNVGGLESVLRKSFEPFFSDTTVLGEFRERNGKALTLRVPGRGKGAYGGRVLVLIDEGSMSAAEIFAAGMQESGRGLIIGRRSGGQVLANRVWGLPTGFKAVIAIRDYRTAKGIRLEQRGVIPDEPVALTMKDFLDRRDPDLTRASERLKTAQ